MDWQKNRLWIGSVVLAVLAIGAGVLYTRNTGDTPASERLAPQNFPDLDEDDIRSLEITRPGEETVHLELRDDDWWVTAPVEARADQSVVRTALERLDGLEVTGIVANHAEHHAELEVGEDTGIHVVVGGASGELADLWIGASRSSHTMVRVEGGDQVVSVRDSIKHAFNKALRDWRDRALLDLDDDDVIEISWTGPNHTFHFRRPLEPAAGGDAEPEGEEEDTGPTYGSWEIVEVSYLPESDEDAGPVEPLTTIENFAPNRVASVVTNLARMRASDFPEGDVTLASAGLAGPEAPRVTLTVRDGEGTRTETVILGEESDASDHDHYATRDGSGIVYVISSYLTQRVSPTASTFEQTAAAAGAAAGDAPPGMPAGLPPGMDSAELLRMLEAANAGAGH